MIDLGNFTFHNYYEHLKYNVGTSSTSNVYYKGYSRSLSSSNLYFDKEDCKFKWGDKYEYTKVKFPKIYGATWDSSANGDTKDTDYVLRLITNAVKNSIIGKYSYLLSESSSGNLFRRNTSVDTSTLTFLIDDKIVCTGPAWVSGENNPNHSISAIGVRNLVGSIEPNSSFELGYNTTHNVKVGYSSYLSDTIKDYSAGYTSIPSNWKNVISL